jgi:hypothetical protein
MRYLLLVALNLPVIILAFANIITRYKLEKVSKSHFRHQILLWFTIVIVLVASFPVYNVLLGRPILQSNTFSLFDIVQTTAIVYLIYIINDQRRKIEKNEKIIRDLHQELSIRLSR